ncbi:hypothetical protein PAXRUDRAFT_134533 [Paxillus rubicundulus Ve08.2h10]|uniref:Tc1-like transposase DDE domain-containing protein n=1 Tax=Paxillus rubicundulus Ve08.2h10 TaxID=930991 RepID=A0A0D0E2L7_9AGAM|nr:hypothetical protein PAXRUDRAFT_134533 [Paxillus rubicundulus Ve08.2h10]
MSTLLGWHCGHSQKGKCAHKKQLFIHGRHISTKALMTLDGIIGCTTVEGFMMKELFLEWLEFTVLPKCFVYPGPLSVLMLDNAKIHHGAEVLELVDRFGP